MGGGGDASTSYYLPVTTYYYPSFLLPSVHYANESDDLFSLDHFLAAGTQRSVAWTLQNSVRVQCGSNYLTAALPRPMAEALGVIGLFLNDRSCSGKRNATHWTVKTLVTSCGSTSRIDGKLTTYSNAVSLGKEKWGISEE